MKRKLLILTFLSVLLFIPKMGYAFFEGIVKDLRVEVHSLNRYFPESEEENNSNELSVAEVNLDVNFDINPDSDFSWEWDFGFKHVFIGNNPASIDLPDVLVGRSMRLASQFPVPLLDDSRYRIGLSAIPSYFTDSWQDSFNDFETGAFRWLSEYWIEYEGYDNFSWKLGIKLRPEHDQLILPVVGLHYQFNDQWSLRLTSDDFGVIYQWNDQIQLFTEHRYVLDEYEISSGGRNGRVLRHKQNTTGVGVQYNFNEESFLKFSVGGAYNRSFKFVDGEDEGKAVLKDSVYTTLELVWNF